MGREGRCRGGTHTERSPPYQMHLKGPADRWLIRSRILIVPGLISPGPALKTSIDRDGKGRGRNRRVGGGGE